MRVASREELEGVEDRQVESENFAESRAGYLVKKISDENNVISESNIIQTNLYNLNHPIMSADIYDSLGRLPGSIIPAFEVCLKIGSTSVS